MTSRIIEPRDLKLEHVLVFCYLYFSKESDGEVAESECVVIKSKVGEWMGANCEVEDAFRESETWFLSCNLEERTQALRYFLARFRERLSSMHRKAILSDLYQVACADGIITSSEAALLNTLAIELDVDFKVEIPD